MTTTRAYRFWLIRCRRNEVAEALSTAAFRAEYAAQSHYAPSYDPAFDSYGDSYRHSL